MKINEKMSVLMVVLSKHCTMLGSTSCNWNLFFYFQSAPFNSRLRAWSVRKFSSRTFVTSVSHCTWCGNCYGKLIRGDRVVLCDSVGMIRTWCKQSKAEHGVMQIISCSSDRTKISGWLVVPLHCEQSRMTHHCQTMLLFLLLLVHAKLLWTV